MDVNDLKRLVEEGAQESSYLDFKRGDALDAQNDKKAEFVKDVTSFANASGGRIIYGISEKKVDGIGVAADITPVTSTRITKEWLSSVIVDKTAPRFTDFDIHEVAVDGGRVIVVDIKAAATAHQNLSDFRYYQRVGVVTSALTDFQIRDLMSRRTRPLANVGIACKALSLSPDLHRYQLSVVLENVGLVTMEKWWIDVLLPPGILRDTRNGPEVSYSVMNAHHLYSKMVRNVTESGAVKGTRICFGDPFVDGRRFILHPGQKHSFDEGDAQLPQFIIEIDSDTFRSLSNSDSAIGWTLFCNDAHPTSGRLDFQEWCNF